MKFVTQQFFIIINKYKPKLELLKLSNTPIFNGSDDFTRNKQLISISPAGYKGFYVFGVCKYIKQHYNLDNYIFSGASAGAWNSLFLCFKGDIDEIQKKIMDESLQTPSELNVSSTTYGNKGMGSLQKTKTINELENLVKTKILQNYTCSDFDLDKLFIGVTTFHNYKSNTIIHSGFDNLEDALNCCIASSHIPFINGKFKNIYRNVLTFDGGFSRYPYLNTQKPSFHINPGVWKEQFGSNKNTLKMSDYTTLFSKECFNFDKMIELGYQDTKNNTTELDLIFKKNIKE